MSWRRIITWGLALVFINQLHAIGSRGNQALTGVTSVVLPLKVSLKWNFKTGMEIKAAPVVAGNRIVVGSTDENVYCLDLNGKLLWKYKTDNAIEASALILNNTVYIGNLSGNFYALNLLNGKLRWKFRADNQIMGGANWWTDGKKTCILVGSYDFYLRCLDAATGKLLWKYEAQNYINATVAIWKNQAVFGGCDGLLHVVNLTNGKRVTTSSIGTYIASPVALENNRAYIGDYDGKVTCMDFVHKTVFWQFKNPNKEIPIVSAPTVFGNRVMIGSKDRFFYCFDKNTGKILWKRNTGSPVEASSIADTKNVLVSNMRGDILLLNQILGSVLWTYELGSPSQGGPVVCPTGIAIGAKDGRLYFLGTLKK
ncbi:MAG TPA: PQQ-binding-like beta-propeller repeat protein [Bacteroidales bacterium]|nr:PQQ-binding-like beta-propeller repeat protein [Bacteroidales bacterium]